MIDSRPGRRLSSQRLHVEAGSDVEVSRGKGEPWEGIFMIVQGGILDEETGL
jgi:hypothetical protein